MAPFSGFKFGVFKGLLKKFCLLFAFMSRPTDLCLNEDCKSTAIFTPDTCNMLEIPRLDENHKWQFEFAKKKRKKTAAFSRLLPGVKLS